MDIPKTLSECYEYLNNTLDEKRKEKIKKEGGSCEHFGLGLWIRNNWIYPNKNRSRKGDRHTNSLVLFGSVGIFFEEKIAFYPFFHLGNC